jgi:hypothetical protein
LTVHHPREAHCWLSHRAGAPHAGGLSGTALRPSTEGVVVVEGGRAAGLRRVLTVGRWFAVHPVPVRWLRLTPVFFALVKTVHDVATYGKQRVHTLWIRLTRRGTRRVSLHWYGGPYEKRSAASTAWRTPRRTRPNRPRLLLPTL